MLVIEQLLLSFVSLVYISVQLVISGKNAFFVGACSREHTLMFDVAFTIENLIQRLVLYLKSVWEDFLARRQIAYHCHGVKQRYNSIAAMYWV